MPRILIAGCGYLGAATADLFHAAQWEVEGWTASRDSAQALSGKPYSVRAVDIGNRAQVGDAGGEFSVVIHCASTRGGGESAYGRVYLEGARNLAAVFPAALLVFTSSTSVYAQANGEWVTESSAAEPQRRTGRILRETEEFVLARGGVVARLAGIYGPGRSALLRKFLADSATIDAGEQRFVNQIHRDDAAAALSLLVEKNLGSEAATSRERCIYNVADGQPITRRDCYDWLAAHLHRPLPPVGVQPTGGKRGKSNKRVSNAKLRALGWSPRYPTFASAMTESILPTWDDECVERR
ncbi:MAG: NAD-dependent epimerase/dehydratase family protein [Chthoniobacterales bacterium]